VSIGYGKTAKFWSSSWLQGMTAKNVAPTLFKKAKRKQITVQKALQNNKWIAHITPVSSLLGTIKRDTQIREVKIAKKGIRQITRDHQGSGAGSVSPEPLASGASSGSPDPLASGASSALPDPSWAWAQTPPCPSPHLGARFSTHSGRTVDMTYAVIPIPRQGMATTVPTTPATV